KTLGSLVKDVLIYDSTDPYPLSWYDIQIGGGLDKENNHVTILSIRMYPVRYIPKENNLTLSSAFDISIIYELPQQQICSTNGIETYDLVIIAPSQYASDLVVLKDHKQRCGLPTMIKTTEAIYTEFNGRDNAEKIKYFIKHAIETFDTKYVLLIGDIKQLPIRSTDAYPWDPYHGVGLLSDLYYADIYDASGAFCSWDANNNNIFGEVVKDRFPPLEKDNIDKVDLYPDVHIGRIPCSTNEELITMINKIITYEKVTYNQIWFQKIILIGGDTFPLTKGSPPNVFEGEITNIKVAQQLPDFEKIYLWASERNLNARTFNKAISQGAGFVSYAGHGFEHGWGTYRPNAIIDGNLIIYYSPFIKAIDNGHRLPIIFFDACLTAKFDFNITDLIGYYGLKARLVNILLGGYTSEDYFSPFAWSFIKHEGGGGIAAVGATRPAYTYVDKDGVYAGAGYLDVHFFKAYYEGVSVGEMLTSSQNDYLNNVGFDIFTIEEFLLLGDPSLRVGGYPDGSGIRN
ncbi:MAG: C25 family cysteine peptidase, partial [Candidatus Thermoplasmatota archaeon]|nr:C25 family cysteine peptidase [Candidatus Thermoplasmatota archaeon]